MIDWNNNGTIDPEEIILTEAILAGEGRGDNGQKGEGREDDDWEEGGDEETGGGGRAFDLPPQPRHTGCLFSLLAIPLLLVLSLLQRP